MAFLESPRFPDGIAYGSKGGPKFNTIIAALESGQEKRSSMWSLPLHEYDVSYGIRDLDDVLFLRTFFMAMYGRANAFRFKDFADYTSSEYNAAVSDTDVVFATGDGSTTAFQLTKIYTAGAENLIRPIIKPVSGTVVVAVDSVSQTEGVDFTVDTTTGIVTFTAAPAVDAALSWGGEFDVPCRFADDKFELTQDYFQGGHSEVILQELRSGSL